MKVGDKVYCIKNNNGHSIGCTYIILKLSDNEIELSVDKGSKTDPVLFSGLDVVSRAYYLDNPIDKFSYFYDHFVGVRTHRKLKLEKINERVYSEG